MITQEQLHDAQQAAPDMESPQDENTAAVSDSAKQSNLKARIVRPRFAVAALLLVLAFLFMLPSLPPFGVGVPMGQLLVFPPWKASFTDPTPLLRGGDVLLQQLPWHHWIQDEILAGRFPLWASAPLGGTPVFASFQPAVLYPLSLLWAILPTGAGFGIIMALKLWLAGLGMYGFLRAMNLHRLASLVAAVGFMFSAGMIVWLPWSNTGVELLFPWLCWGVYAWCVQKKRAALAGLAVAAVCGIFGGNPEILLIVAITVGLWTLGLLLGSKLRDWPRQIVGLGAAGVVAGLLGGIQLLPFLEALDMSHTRFVRAAVGNIAYVHVDISMALDWVMPRWWGQQSDNVMAGAGIFTESNAYVGIAALVGLVLAIVGIFKKSVNYRLLLPWIETLAIGWVLAYDDAFGRVVRNLPMLHEMIGSRWIQSVGFSLLVVGAFGWDWAARTIEQFDTQKRRDAFMKVGAGLAVVGIGVGLAHLVGLIPYTEPPGDPCCFRNPDAGYRTYWAVWSAAVLVGMLGLGLLWRSLPSRRFVLGGGLVLLVVADLWRLLYTYNPAVPSEQYYPATSFIKQLSAQVQSPERFVAQDFVMPANTGLVFNIRDWRYQDPMINQRAYEASVLLSPGYENEIMSQYNMLLMGVRPEVAPLFGIRYLVYPNGINPSYWEPDPDRPEIKRLAYTEGLGLWEITGVPGFTYLSDAVDVAADKEAASNWIKDLTWAKIRSYPAVVEAPASDLASISPSPDGSSPGSANVVTYTPGHIVIQTDASRSALLVVAETFYPGWRATLDGQPVGVLRTNYISQGVVVPDGKHSIELKYEPGSFRYGAMLSGVGLAALAGLVFWWRREARRATAV